MARHKHADLIIAWANGARIEGREVLHGTMWREIPTPMWVDGYEYRIKPSAKKYRLYLYVNRNTADEIIRVANEGNAISIARQAGFVKWLGDWQEVEI